MPYVPMRLNLGLMRGLFRTAVDDLPAYLAQTDGRYGTVLWRGRAAMAAPLPAARDVDNNEVPWCSGQDPVGLYEHYVARLNNVVIYPPDGMVQLANGAFVRTLSWLRDIPTLRTVALPHSCVSMQLSGSHVSILSQWCGSYYHWLIDCLPRLHNLDGVLPPNAKFVVPQNPARYVLDSLSRMGVPNENAIPLRGVPYNAETLYLVSPLAMTGDCDGDALRWLRDKLSGSSECVRLRIYISRKRALSRRALNEHELLPILRRFGFRVVECETLTFDETVKLFSQAAFIVGPHGAGLANMLFSPPGTTVLELHEPSTLRRCYRAMAHALGHNHVVEVATAVPSLEAEPNMVLSPSRLSVVLGRLCG